jgi:hypothetical protein
MNLFLIALVIIVLGLVIVYLSAQGGSLSTVFKWAGWIVAVLGLILLLLRPIAWLGKQLSDAFGV